MISRIVVSIAPPKDTAQAINPGDLKTLTDHFHGALEKSLKPQMQIVDTTGPGVVVLRISQLRGVR